MVPNIERDDLPHDGHGHRHSPNTDDNLVPSGALDTARRTTYIQPSKPPRYLYIIARFDTEVKQKM